MRLGIVAASVSRSGFRARLARFRSDQTGALVIFALMLALLMMMMGGIAVDVMRYESRRTSLQNTLDRSTLAAAALSQGLVPGDVVNDHFLKAGLAEYLTSVIVTESQSARSVSATAAADAQPMFLHLMGINEFEAPGISTAEQSISNVEIMLVPDVSGSMSGDKITKLRLAATEFVETVLDGDDDHHVSIGIVPYNAQVNLGPAVRAKFNATRLHGVAGVDCLELPDDVFATTDMPLAVDFATATELPQMSNADISSSTSKTTTFIEPTSSSYAVPYTDNNYCRSEQRNIVRLPNNDLVTLQAQIMDLQAEGNTSIVLGMKWGAALLDPGLRDTYAEWIAEGAIPATIANRPFDYGANGLKVIVLMTDGEHVAHNRIVDSFKSGASPIWKNAADNDYSVQHTGGRPVIAGANEFYVPHLNTWQATAWGNEVALDPHATQQDWTQIWASMRMTYVAWQFYARALGTSSGTRTSVYNDTTNAMTDNWNSATAMNALLQENCAAIRDQDVIIYGIAFQAPTNGQTQIRNCSTDGAAGTHYFNATTVNISLAFQSIASNISQLRLTQ